MIDQFARSYFHLPEFLADDLPAEGVVEAVVALDESLLRLPVQLVHQLLGKVAHV